MTHGSLFSGIGGFDYAADQMGWINVFHCEIEPFPRKILNYYWPKAISYEDIKTTDFSVHRGQIDVLTGGFPCQPYSVAGSRKGKEDDRHLWPEMLRAIRELAPSWIVGENVPGIISWNGGLVFEEVCIDLENEGYEVQPIVLPAVSKNAPHRRDRVWFIAYNNCNGQQSWNGERKRGNKREKSCSGIGERLQFKNITNGFNRNASNTKSLRINREKEYENSSGQSGERRGCNIDNLGEIQERNASTNAQRQGLEGKNMERMGEPTQFAERTTSNSDGTGLQTKRPQQQTTGAEQCGELDRGAAYSDNQRRKERNNAGIAERQEWSNWEFTPLEGWQNFPTQPPVCGGNDGVPTRLDGITFPKWRNESIKGYGNAVVPQVVIEIFKVIDEMHKS